MSYDFPMHCPVLSMLTMCTVWYCPMHTIHSCYRYAMSGMTSPVVSYAFAMRCPVLTLVSWTVGIYVGRLRAP
eukprot:2771850-Rhodomonas_salina.1